MMEENIEKIFENEIVELLLKDNDALHKLVALAIQKGIYPMIDSDGVFIGYNVHSDDGECIFVANGSCKKN